MATEAAATAAMRGKVGTETTSNAGQRHLVRVIGTPVTFRTPPGIPLLHGMIAAGASAVPVGCRGGGCGICRIQDRKRGVWGKSRSVRGNLGGRRIIKKKT